MCVEIWPRGGVYEYFTQCAWRQRHFVWEGVLMGAGAVVQWVCAAPPQPGQEQRIPAVLQTDAGTKAPAAHRILCRYNMLSMSRLYVEVSFHHKMAVMLKHACLCSGNVLLLVLLAAQLPLKWHTYMLLSILGLELLVALPCLLYYTGKPVSVITFSY